MNNWLDSVFSCCSKRKKNDESIQMRSVEAPIMESIEALTPVIHYSSKDERDTNSVIDLESPVLSFSKEEVKAPIGKVAKPPTQSRRSTKESFAALDSANLLLSTLNCVDCMDKAVGYCLGCPSKRFCQDCFYKLHLETSPLHVFCKYSTKPRNPRRRSFINR